MRPSRGLLVLAALLLLGLALPWAGWKWLEGPAGAVAASGWVTRRLPDSLSDTEVRLEGLRLHPFSSLEVGRVTWRTQDGRSIVELKDLTLTARSGLFTFRAVEWDAVADAERMDLAGLDKTLLDGSWKAEGALAGVIRFSGTGGAVQAVETDLESLKPGGNLNSRVLERLLTALPVAAVLQRSLGEKAELVQQIRSRPVFHFDIGRVKLDSTQERYVLKLFLDGDHLLDLTVRLPKSGLEIVDFLIYLGQ